jgi:hypothetical protein
MRSPSSATLGRLVRQRVDLINFRSTVLPPFALFCLLSTVYTGQGISKSEIFNCQVRRCRRKFNRLSCGWPPAPGARIASNARMSALSRGRRGRLLSLNPPAETGDRPPDRLVAVCSRVATVSGRVPHSQNPSLATGVIAEPLESPSGVVQPSLGTRRTHNDERITLSTPCVAAAAAATRESVARHGR